MTTIAYNHKDKEIAVDGRVTRGSTICDDNCNKVVKTKQASFILSGRVSDIDKVIHAFPDNVELNSAVSGFVILEDAVYWFAGDDTGWGMTEVTYNEAAGSGSEFALTALDMGATAKQAVKMAAKRDTMTGGKIRVIKLK